MRALIFHGPWDLRVEDRPDQPCTVGQVQVTIIAAGICGSDLHGFTGESGRRKPGQVMGHEVAGRVSEVGAGVGPGHDLAAGMAVTVNPALACGACPACKAGWQHRCERLRIVGVHPAVSGGFAEHLVVPAGNVIPLPAGMPEEHGALVEPLTVGLHAARRGRCQPDDRVLVIGGGPIGQACALAAGRLGVEAVVVTEPDPHRRSVVAGLGFNVLDPAAETLPDRVSDLLGGPATVVLDAVGASASFADAFEAAAVGARIVLVGMNTPRLDLSGYAISTREREIIGSFCYTAEEFRSTVEWAAAAPVELDRLVDGRVGLDEAPGCFTALGRGEMSASKIFVLPRG